MITPVDKVKSDFGHRGAGEGQFTAICGFLVGPDETIYVLDQQALAIQLLDAQGNFIRGWGRHDMGDENVYLPSGMALDFRGRICVCVELCHQVKIFIHEGALLGVFGGLGHGSAQLSVPTDVSADQNVRVYVAERTTGRVQVF